jgi:hypothetical protein
MLNTINICEGASIILVELDQTMKGKKNEKDDFGLFGMDYRNSLYKPGSRGHLDKEI